MAGKEDVINAISAGAGGFVSSMVLYPVEIIKNRYQAALQKNQKKRGTDDLAPFGRDVDEKGDAEEEVERVRRNDENETVGQTGVSFQGVVTSTYETQGLLGFYKGVLHGSGQSATEKALYNVIFQKLRRACGFSANNWIALLVLGYISEWSHMPLTMPMDVALKLYQIGQKDRPPKSYVRCVRDHYDAFGWRGFYAGIDAYVILCGKPAIQYAVFETVKPWFLLRGAKDLTALRAFLVGALSRAIATLVIYPYIRANAVLKGMLKDRDDDKKVDTTRRRVKLTTMSVLLYVLNAHGPLALYQGLTPQLSRGVMSAALAMLVKERIASNVRRALG